jgi:hypothetical protein
MADPAQTGQIGPDGRIAGIDGVLDQITEAIGRQIVPILQQSVLPVLQRDKELQREVGAAAGAAAARTLLWPAYIAAGSLVVLTGWVVVVHPYLKAKRREQERAPELPA